MFSRLNIHHWPSICFWLWFLLPDLRVPMSQPEFVLRPEVEEVGREAVPNHIACVVPLCSQNEWWILSLPPPRSHSGCPDASFTHRALARGRGSAISPKEFCQHIQMWLATKLDRPHEPLRKCVLMDQCRDWILGFPPTLKEGTTHKQTNSMFSFHADSPKSLFFNCKAPTL